MLLVITVTKDLASLTSIPRSDFCYAIKAIYSMYTDTFYQLVRLSLDVLSKAKHGSHILSTSLGDIVSKNFKDFILIWSYSVQKTCFLSLPNDARFPQSLHNTCLLEEVPEFECQKTLKWVKCHWTALLLQ